YAIAVTPSASAASQLIPKPSNVAVCVPPSCASAGVAPSARMSTNTSNFAFIVIRLLSVLPSICEQRERRSTLARRDGAQKSAAENRTRQKPGEEAPHPARVSGMLWRARPLDLGNRRGACGQRRRLALLAAQAAPVPPAIPRPDDAVRQQHHHHNEHQPFE